MMERQLRDAAKPIPFVDGTQRSSELIVPTSHTRPLGSVAVYARLYYFIRQLVKNTVSEADFII